MKNELERLKKKISDLTPGTEEYERTLSEIERVTKLVRQDDLDTDKRIREKRQLELDEKKFQHEQMKFEQSLEDNAKRAEFETKKFEFEQAKFEHQREEDYKRHTLEDEKARNEAAENEYKRSARYTMRQIVTRGIDLGLQAVFTGGLIVLVGNLEQVAILPKTPMQFINKHF